MHVSNTNNCISIPSIHLTIGIKKAFWILEMHFDPIISLFTQCLSDLLCLETLKHGTSIWNYLKIRIEGANPEHGGKKGGSSSASNPRYMTSSKGYFYMFKDSAEIKLEFPPLEMQIEGNKATIDSFKREILHNSPYDLFLTSYIKIPLRTRMHAMLSGWSYQEKALLIAKVLSAVLSIFTPTVNLRFIPEELDLFRYDQVKAISNNELADHEHRFMEDEDFAGIAWKTREKIGIEHIGFYGIISQGFKGDLVGRIKQNPKKCISGGIRLVALSILVGLILQSIVSRKYLRTI